MDGIDALGRASKVLKLSCHDESFRDFVSPLSGG